MVTIRPVDILYSILLSRSLLYTKAMFVFVFVYIWLACSLFFIYREAEINTLTKLIMKVDPVLLGVLTLVSALIIDIFLKIDIFYIILFTELIFKLKKYIYILYHKVCLRTV